MMEYFRGGYKGALSGLVDLWHSFSPNIGCFSYCAWQEFATWIVLSNLRKTKLVHPLKVRPLRGEQSLYQCVTTKTDTWKKGRRKENLSRFQKQVLTM